MIVHSGTPLGILLAAQPSNFDILGGGRRVGTLRNRIRGLKKFIEFLTVSFDIAYTSTVEHFTSYLRMRVSEPRSRCWLNHANRALGFLEEVRDCLQRTTQRSRARPDVETSTSHFRRDVACLGDNSDGWSNTNVLAFVQLVDDLAMFVNAKCQRPPRNQLVLSNNSRIVTLGIAVVV